LEFFLNDTVDPSGYGQGKVFIGAAAVATHGTNPQDFSVSFPDGADKVEIVESNADTQLGLRGDGWASGR